MEYQEDYNIEQEEPAKRPEMLTVICILSFINAVYNGIVNFISFAFYDTFQNVFEQMRNGEGMFADMAEQMGDSWETMAEASALAFSVGRGYYFIEMVLFIASFVGVLMMWKLQKRGFHVYAIAQILMLIATSICVVSKIGGGFPFGPILWTALFVMTYFSYYKKVMK
ncbi:MAG: hypothetical protein J6R17_00725 [Bacteroidales bacterium]|nr:hypothetical protein [Bacteroidales bacterium]MBO5854315.1 hypothetical protein [Bacteroidales bacterium]